LTPPKTIVIHSTTTCSTCRTAKRRLDSEGIPYDEVILDLPENAEYLADLKRRREVDIINVPLIQYGSTYRQMDGLRTIIDTYREDHSA
jgi:glutaredoxin